MDIYNERLLDGQPLVGGIDASKGDFLIRPVLQRGNRDSGLGNITHTLQNADTHGWHPGVGGYLFIRDYLGWMEWDIPPLDPSKSWNIHISSRKSTGKANADFSFDGSVVFTDTQQYDASSTATYFEEHAIPAFTEYKPHVLRVTIKDTTSGIYGYRLYEVAIVHD